MTNDKPVMAWPPGSLDWVTVRTMQVTASTDMTACGPLERDAATPEQALARRQLFGGAGHSPETAAVLPSRLCVDTDTGIVDAAATPGTRTGNATLHQWFGITMFPTCDQCKGRSSHPQRHVDVVGSCVDEGNAELIAALNTVGIRTHFSCQGTEVWDVSSREYLGRQAQIVFEPAHATDMFALLTAAAAHAGPEFSEPVSILFDTGHARFGPWECWQSATRGRQWSQLYGYSLSYSAHRRAPVLVNVEYDAELNSTLLQAVNERR